VGRPQVKAIRDRPSYESSWVMVRHPSLVACRVKSFPTVKAFVNGKAGVEFKGERSASAIKAWAMQLIPNHVATINRQPQVHTSHIQAFRCVACRCRLVWGMSNELQTSYHVH
jgi:hypothetical protein